MVAKLRTAKSFEKLMKELFEKHGLNFTQTGAVLELKDPDGIYMPLQIERIAKDKVSVMHFYSQHSDIMRDPEIVFWTPKSGGWHPIEFRQDGSFALHWLIGEIEGETLRFKPKLYLDICRFAETWASNLRSQGFLDFEATECQDN